MVRRELNAAEQMEVDRRHRRPRAVVPENLRRVHQTDKQVGGEQASPCRREEKRIDYRRPSGSRSKRQQVGGGGEFGGEFLPAECGIDVGKLRHRRPVSL